MTGDLQRALAQTTKEVQVLREIGLELSSPLGLEHALATVLDSVERAFGYAQAIIVLQEEEVSRVAARRGTGALNVDNGLFSKAASEKQIARSGHQVALPLLIRGRFLGVFALETTAFDEDDELLLSAIAAHAAAAIDNAARAEELKNIQSRLLESQKMSALVHLVAGITHEMNSPLGTLVSATDTLERAVGKLRANEAAASQAVLGILSDSNRAIGHASKRIDHIVRKLKSFVRLDEAVEQTVGVESCIDETLALLQHRLEKISVVRDYGPTTPIICYPARLNDVFATLLRNACDAVEGKEDAKIVVRTRQYKKGVGVEIDDNGVGMSEEEIERIFEPGFTTRGSRVRMGLGLAIAYQVVHDHGGEIGFESQLGCGTKVSIDLPASAPAPAPKD